MEPRTIPNAPIFPIQRTGMMEIHTHLTPSLVHLLLQRDNLVELAHVRRDDEDVRLSGELSELLPDVPELGLVHVRNCDFEFQSTGRGQQLKVIYVLSHQIRIQSLQ